MIKKWERLALLLAFVNFSWFTTFGQDAHHVALAVGEAPLREEKDDHIKATSFIIPGTFLAYGSLKPVISGIRNLDDDIMLQVRKNHPSFHTNAADYLMWAPAASIYIADAFKIKSRHSFGEHLVLDAGSLVLTGGIGYAMREMVRNHETFNSQDTKFPSGHTANAFRGAEILHQEFKDDHRLLSYSGYVVATAVGVLRIYNKTHLLTEVIAGAGLGMLSTKLTYWIFNKWKDRRDERVSLSRLSLQYLANNRTVAK